MDAARLRTRLVVVLFAAVGTLVAVLAVGRRRERRETTRRLDDLRTAEADRPEPTVDAEEFEGLPDPVRRYLRTAIPEGRRRVEEVRLEQEGTLRLGGQASPWKPFTATQWISTHPPGFLWQASVRVAPLLSPTVRDAYVDGDGSARVSLFGLVPLGGADPSPELNQAELVRYLAEAVWCPTALRPSEGVEWEAVDDNSARATLEHGGATASLTFHFAEGVVARVHAEERYREVDGDLVPTPWTGRWRDYQRRNGMLVPTAGEVVWHLPDGDLTAWRGRVTDVDHRPG
jgi:hypothetical protein